MSKKTETEAKKPDEAVKNRIVIDLDEMPEGERFYWNKEASTGPFVELRIVPAPVSETLRKKHTRKKVEHVQNPATRRMDRVEFEEFNSDAYNRDFWDYVLTNYGGGWVNKDGEEYPCDAETKVKLITSPKFMTFLSESFETLNENRRAREEELEKNS